MEDVKGKSIQELLELGNIRTDVTFEAFDKEFQEILMQVQEMYQRFRN